MKNKLSISVVALLCAVLMQSCAYGGSLATASKESSVGYKHTILQETEDMGSDYIDSFLFFGESTTYHMKNREVLSGGSDTKQILADKSGTATLDMSTYKMIVVEPNSGALMPLGDAIAAIKPEYIILTFGLNGAVGNVSRGEEYFSTCYKKLIDTVRRSSPDTKIILQSCFPVAKNMDTSNYTVNVDVLNEYISILNAWTLSVAREEDLRYLDTQEILTDENGFLKLEYQSGDGYHLTKSAYLSIIDYIRTHGYK